jgi:hypothetical protein
VHHAADLLISVVRNAQTDSGKDRFAAKVGKCSAVGILLAPATRAGGDEAN